MPNADENNKLQELLKLLSVNNDFAKNQIKEEQKNFKEYKFWKTQPVAKFEEIIEEEGPINSSKTVDQVSKLPYPLIDGFDWCTLDITNSKDLEDVFILLNENYIEDKTSTFSFNYTREFFNWALKPPGWKKDWHVGVRVCKSGRLVAFISGIPINLRIRDKVILSVEINFLCVHKKLRSKRLAPILIKEITRRINLQNIWQALYSAGVVLPSPVSTCRYTHRPLNWSKLFDVGFTSLSAKTTKTQMVAKYALPKNTMVEGLRPMTEADIDESLLLFNKYQTRFDLAQSFSREEFKHWFLGTSETSDIIFSYVVENIDGKITDLISFYSLPFNILKNVLHKKIGIAYLFYYASDSDFAYEDRFDPEGTLLLRNRLKQLVNDACIIARTKGMDVFNALSSQDNTLFLEDLKFGLGDGFLNFYLFNYRAKPISGGLTPQNKLDSVIRSNIGVVML